MTKQFEEFMEECNELEQALFELETTRKAYKRIIEDTELYNPLVEKHFNESEISFYKMLDEADKLNHNPVHIK